MLSKILQINRNFLSIGVIIIFALIFIAFDASNFISFQQSLPILGVLIVAIFYSFAIKSTGYYPNQYFTFFILLFSMTFYTGQHSFHFFVAYLFLGIIQSQLILEARHGNSMLNSFDLGFFSGFFVIFYLPFGLFMVPGWIYYLSLGKVEFRKTIFHLIGIITFFILIVELYFVFDLEGMFNFSKATWQFNFFKNQPSSWFLMPIVIIVLLGFVDYLRNLNRQPAHKKLVIVNVIIYAIVAMIYIGIWGGLNSEKFLLLSFPMSLFLTNYFTHESNVIKKEVLLWIVILSILLYKLGHYIILPNWFDSISF